MARINSHWWKRRARACTRVRRPSVAPWNAFSVTTNCRASLCSMHTHTRARAHTHTHTHIYLLDDSCRSMITLVLNTCSDKKEDLWKNMGCLEKTIYRDKAPRTAKRILFPFFVLFLSFSFSFLSLSLSLPPFFSIGYFIAAA